MGIQGWETNDVDWPGKSLKRRILKDQGKTVRLVEEK